jgi:branched-chain amino acid transport system ATP-binding protein
VALLEIRNISKKFGGLIALNNLTFDVNKGEILGIIGPNGAGKTTLFNVITGIYKPTGDRGKILFKNENIVGLKPFQIAKKGLVRSFQAASLFGQASILENVALGCHLHRKPSFWGGLFNTPSYRIEEKKVCQKAREILEFLGFEAVDGLATLQPLGHQKALGLATALAAQSELLLADEPLAGMSAQEIMTIIEAIQRARDTGLTFAIIEHNVQALMGVADRIVVLNYGEKIAEGSPEEISKDKKVIEAYLGTKKHVT